MTLSIGIKLIDEIERVAALRAQYEAVRGMRGVNVEPAIFMMSQAIDRAKAAIADGDAVIALTALADLEAFTG